MHIARTAAALGVYCVFRDKYIYIPEVYCVLRDKYIYITYIPTRLHVRSTTGTKIIYNILYSYV